MHEHVVGWTKLKICRPTTEQPKNFKIKESKSKSKSKNFKIKESKSTRSCIVKILPNRLHAE